MRWFRLTLTLLLLVLPGLAAAQVCDDVDHLKTLANQWEDYANELGELEDGGEIDDEERTQSSDWLAKIEQPTRELATALEDDGESDFATELTSLVDEFAELERDDMEQNDIALEIQELIVNVVRSCG